MKKIITIILVISMVVGLYNTNISKAMTDSEGKKVFHGDGFDVTYEISSIWDKGYIANVYIKNTGIETIENWELSYQSVDEYSNIWNGVTDYRSAKYYNIKNAKHNQNIKPGETVSFGFQAIYNGEKPDIPDKYELIGDHLVIENKVCSPKFEVVNSWENGCIMNVSLENKSDNNIEDWTLECRFDYKIDNIWRATICKNEGNRYIFKNCEYNSIICPGETETFGMQISFEEGTEFKVPYDILFAQYKKDDYHIDFDKNWNVSMIRADDISVREAKENNKYTIKVCMLDSGIDYSPNIKVKNHIDLTENYEDKNPIFEDLSGHGTAVAGILASDSRITEDGYEFENKYLKKMAQEKVNGINQYVKLYSAEILDENNETTVNQMVDGIEWAIEKDVKIINISCGLEKDSNKLHNAIKKAKNKGILVIAAAGDGETISYPAKYPEVMAVGAVKCDGSHMKESPVGNEIEVVAPGEDVTTYGPFGILTNESGTSIATPHVSALAAILWQQDATKSADFIRELIKVSAHALGDKKQFGYGLIDCSYALEKYEDYAKVSNFAETNEMIVYNENALMLTDASIIKGYWSGKKHEATALVKIKAVKKGSIWPDIKQSGIAGMKKHPQFHGYYTADYIDAFIQLTKIASKLYNKPQYIEKKKESERTLFENAVYTAIKENKLRGKENISAFVYGMALHTAADIFAHSATGVKGQNRKKLKKESVKNLAKKWNILKHGPKNPKTKKFYPKKNMADSTKCINNRYSKGAKKVCSAIINQAFNKNKKATEKVFLKVKYYKTVQQAKKIKKDDNKKKYLINSYGLLNLNKYLKPDGNKKLKKVVNNLANKKVKGVVNLWE